MFEMFTRELHATFLRTTTRGRKTPRRHPHPRQPPQLPEARGRCTRSGALHPIRGTTPEQKRCIAYGSGALPQHTRTNAELARRTTHRRTPPCAARPYWRQDGHAAHATTCTPAHSDTLTCEEPVKPPRDEAVVGLSDRGLACCLASGRASRPARISGSSHCGVWGWCSKRPGDRGQCRGTTTEHRSSPGAPHQPKVARNLGTLTFHRYRENRRIPTV